METLRLNILCGHRLGFKSYYVVWKQMYNIFSSQFLHEFKSYYVVWKQRNPLKLCLPVKGLNRTM